MGRETSDRFVSFTEIKMGAAEGRGGGSNAPDRRLRLGAAGVHSLSFEVSAAFANCKLILRDANSVAAE